MIVASSESARRSYCVRAAHILAELTAVMSPGSAISLSEDEPDHDLDQHNEANTTGGEDDVG
jgi:hypothetical protein